MASGPTWSAAATAGTAVLRIVVSNDSMKKATATSQGNMRVAGWAGAGFSVNGRGVPEELMRCELAGDGWVRRRSHLHDFGFFFAGELFHAANFFVGHLLHFFQRSLLFVFADLLFLRQFFEHVVAVAADIADGGA